MQIQKIGELYKDAKGNLYIKDFNFYEELYLILSYKKVMPRKETIKEKSIY